MREEKECLNIGTGGVLYNTMSILYLKNVFKVSVNQSRGVKYSSRMDPGLLGSGGKEIRLEFFFWF